MRRMRPQAKPYKSQKRTRIHVENFSHINSQTFAFLFIYFDIVPKNNMFSFFVFGAAAPSSDEVEEEELIFHTIVG